MAIFSKRPGSSINDYNPIADYGELSAGSKPAISLDTMLPSKVAKWVDRGVGNSKIGVSKSIKFYGER